MHLPISTLVVVALVLVAIAILSRVVKLKFRVVVRKDDGTDLFNPRSSILSPAERSFAGVLDGALPDGVTWLAKVRLGDVVVTKKGLSNSERTSARNRINQKHVDFLLVRVSDFAPLAAVELDDRSHEEEDRRDRDTFVDAVAKSAGLPLLHQPAQAAYNPAELREKVAALVGNIITPAKAPAAKSA